MYTRSVDSNADMDNWLQGLTDEQIRRVKQAHHDRQREQDEGYILNAEELYKRIITFLKSNETIRRLGGGTKKLPVPANVRFVI
jgi:hypothetical protein